MKVSIEVAGRKYMIEIEGNDDTPKQILLDGKKVPVDVSPGWTKQFEKSLLIGEKSHRIEFEYEEGGIPKAVWVNGIPADISINFPGKMKIHGHRTTGLIGSSKDRIVAPIPGKIVDVKVEEGEEVKAGQVLVVLEAMKMENELAAPGDATVKQILCKEGDNVDLEQILINLS